MGNNYDKGFYKFDLDIQLEGQVQNYEEDRQAYWENLGGWSAIEYENAERFAKAVLKNSEQLIPVEEIDDDLLMLKNEIRNRREEYDGKIFDILDSDLPNDKKNALVCDVLKNYPLDPQSEESPLKLVWERFAIDMSWGAIDKIRQGASRIFRLYKLVLHSTPSKPTQQFLGRLSRCYIWGFDPECIILCRAVIDTAFQEKIAYEICEKHFGKRNRGWFSLSDRIQAALKEEIIDEDIEEKARNVEKRGNIAVHRQPDITKDVWGTICDTVSVLERITE